MHFLARTSTPLLLARFKASANSESVSQFGMNPLTSDRLIANMTQARYPFLLASMRSWRCPRLLIVGESGNVPSSFTASVHDLTYSKHFRSPDASRKSNLLFPNVFSGITVEYDLNPGSLPSLSVSCTSLFGIRESIEIQFLPVEIATTSNCVLLTCEGQWFMAISLLGFSSSFRRPGFGK